MPDERPDLAAWVGRSRTREDALALRPARALAATLDRPPDALASGDPLPAGWHWIYFTPLARRSELAPDGHEKRGSFLPPVPLPRRMWAGGRLRFAAPLRLGEVVRRTSTIASVEEKEGRSGRLVFVRVRHAISGEGGGTVEEEQDLVYREAGPPAARDPVPEPGAPAWSEPFTADVVTLFRFSALTFNGHRIHYDRLWAEEREGYPGLVVHGPLTALLLLDAAGRWSGLPVAAFEYRALAALHVDEPFDVRGREAEGGALELWASHPERGVAMRARAEPAPRRDGPPPAAGGAP